MKLAARFGIQSYLEDRLTVERDYEGSHGLEFVCECPDCGENKLYVNVESGFWICYSCDDGKGSHSGNLFSLVEFLDGLSRRDAFAYVVSGAQPPRMRELSELKVYGVNSGPNEDAKGERNDCDDGDVLPEGYIPIWDDEAHCWNIPRYLEERRIKLRVAKEYRLGWCEGGFGERDGPRLVFPCSIDGRIVTFTGRTAVDREPKYWNHTPMPVAVFGYDQVLGYRRLVLVEGPTDVLACRRAGVPAVCSLGKSLSLGQARLLKRTGADSIVVLFDGGDEEDEAARNAAMVLMDTFNNVRIGRLPDKQDPDSVEPDVLRGAVENAAQPRGRRM